jgi:hypothetical protein
MVRLLSAGFFNGDIASAVLPHLRLCMALPHNQRSWPLRQAHRFAFPNTLRSQKGSHKVWATATRNFVMRLKIQLPTTWAQQPNLNGPPTFRRRGSSNAFQVSWAEYRGGELPDVSTAKLMELAKGFGQQKGLDQLLESSNGQCGFGSFGTAVFRSTKFARVQIWFISDGRAVVMATHICGREPETDEITEVQQIASTIALGPDKA